MEMSYRFRIKPGQHGAFVEWTKKQEANPPQGPEGWAYLSTHVVVQGFGDFDAEVRWTVDDYAALGGGAGSAEFQEANAEFFGQFYDDRFPMRNALTKRADEVFVPEGY